MNHIHESDDVLELYALDRLASTDLIRVEDHLIVCEECRERLEHSAAFAFAVREALRQGPEEAVRPERTSWFRRLGFDLTWKPQFAAAGFAVVILATGIVFLGTRPGAPPASLQLTAMRGEMQTIPPAGKLDLTFQDAPASGSPFRVELVDSTGASVWTGAPETGPGGVAAHIKKAIPAGVYFARLYDSSGKMLHEYGFRAVSQ